MIGFRQFLLVALLVWITPLLATIKMALAYGCFKLISLQLTPGKIHTLRQQIRLFIGWGVGWAIAVQNLDALKQGNYSVFWLDAGLRIGLTAALAALVGLLWFQRKNKLAPATATTYPNPIEHSPIRPPWLLYALLLLLLILFKTGFAQFQLGTWLNHATWFAHQPNLARFWMDQASKRGYPHSLTNPESLATDIHQPQPGKTSQVD